MPVRINLADDSSAVAMCRFRGTIQTSRNSSMIFEVLMPATSVWNGDFMHVGNGGDYGKMSARYLARYLTLFR